MKISSLSYFDEAGKELPTLFSFSTFSLFLNTIQRINSNAHMYLTHALLKTKKTPSLKTKKIDI